jgi:hypothetical protein
MEDLGQPSAASASKHGGSGVSASRTLLRKLDLDLIERLKNGVKHQPKPVRKVKPPREASSYRGARRNVDRSKGWPEATFAKQRPLAQSRLIPLNRSDRWPRAKTYRYAREISPSSEPVR